MSVPFEFRIGWRYTRQGRRGRGKNGFISFISVMSAASIALGVMALIVVLSVMNGFQKEVRDRMLSVIPHVEVISYSGALQNWQQTAEIVSKNSHVLGVAPYSSGQGLLSKLRYQILISRWPTGNSRICKQVSTVSYWA